MKFFTFISIAFVFLIAFGVIYTEWETKNFVESLPKSPPTSDATKETQQAPSDAAPNTVEKTHQLQSEDEHFPLSVESDSSASEIQTSSRKRVNIEIPTTTNTETQRHVKDWRDDNIDSHEHPHQRDPWQSAEDRKALRAEGPNVTVEELRSQLVERFGDIPEVHTFVEIRQRIQDGESLSINEYVKYVESMNRLFPSKQNEQSIETLRQIQRMQNG